MIRNQIIVALILLLASNVCVAFEFSSYGSVTYASNDNDTQNNFSLSQIELIAQRDLSERTYAIIDILFEFEESEVNPEVERLSINRAISDTFEVGLGRFMQPLGFWNHNFSHGALSQDTISRPFLINIEHHERAFLPSHLIGVLLRGETNQWTFNLGAGNSDGINSAAVKATTGPSTVNPINSNPPNNELTIIFHSTYAISDMIEVGLTLGKHNISEVSDGTSGFVDNGEVLFEEQYAAFDFSFNASAFYLFGEYYQIQIDDNQNFDGGASGITANPDTYDATAYYIQGGYRLTPNLRFAARYESLDYDDNATLFQVQRINSRTESTLAVSYLLEESNILRFEAKKEEPDGSKSQTTYALQWYFYLL